MGDGDGGLRCACAGALLATSSDAARRAHIIGGTSATQGQFPYTAWVFDDQNGEKGFCSGTLVASNIVLTAGHCAESTTTAVVNDASGMRSSPARSTTTTRHTASRR